MITRIVQILGILLLISCSNQPALDIEKIKHELDSIHVLDQKYRSNPQSLYLKSNGKSRAFQDALEHQSIIDSSNLVYIIDLINKVGTYPGKSLFGHSASSVSFFVLQHAPDTIQSKYIDLILKASEDNELKRSLVSMYYDRYLMHQGKPQLYGTQIKTEKILDKSTGQIKDTMFVWAIQDTTRIDSLRLWNGLLPLEPYLNSFGLSRWQ